MTPSSKSVSDGVCEICTGTGRVRDLNKMCCHAFANCGCDSMPCPSCQPQQENKCEKCNGEGAIPCSPSNTCLCTPCPLCTPKEVLDAHYNVPKQEPTGTLTTGGEIKTHSEKPVSPFKSKDDIDPYLNTFGAILKPTQQEPMNQDNQVGWEVEMMQFAEKYMPGKGVVAPSFFVSDLSRLIGLVKRDSYAEGTRRASKLVNDLWRKDADHSEASVYADVIVKLAKLEEDVKK